MKIFGIEIDDLSREDVISRVREFLDEPRFHRIATVNPEFLLRAEKDPGFHYSLAAADLRIADGFGIVLAGLLRGKRFTRFAGADLTEEILEIADEKKLSVYLAVRADGLCTFEEVKAAILKKYPNIIIDGADIRVSSHASYLISHASSIILCNFGAPEQEYFLESLREKMSMVRLAMGVGGSFDFMTDKVKRAPERMRAIGLEWLWRLILQPKRWKRIWNAVIVFPFRLISATIGK